MGDGAELTTKDFYTQMTDASSPPANAFTLNAPSGAMCDINASGNVTVNETFANVAHSTLKMTGSKGELAVRTHRSGALEYPRIIDVKLGNFIADGGSDEANATVINSWALFTGKDAVTIKAGKFLKVYASPNAYIQVDPDPDLVPPEAKWVQESGAEFVVNNTITPIVEFGVQGYSDPVNAPDGRTFKISGNTTWHDLVCKEPEATLEFSNHPDLHSVAGEFIAIPLNAAGDALEGGGGAGTNPYTIKLTRADHTSGLTPPWTAPPGDARPPPAVTNDFWHFELKSGASLSFNYVHVQYSWAKNRIPLPLSGEAVILAVNYVYMNPLDGTPDYELANPRGDPNVNFDMAVKKSYYNQNWLVADNFFYSFTEDSDGNGRIDRIRAQAAFELTGNAENSFSNFSAVVDGYKVDSSRAGTRGGYVRVDEDTSHSGLPAAVRNLMKDMIYIYLEEKDYSDTGERLTWRVERNGSLKDYATQSIEIGLPEHGTITAYDTAPPRINHALTMPGTGELYVQFSEPVDFSDPVTVDAVAAGTPRKAGTGDEDRLVPINPAYTVTQLVQPAGTYPKFTVTGVRDRAVFAEDRRSRANEFYAYLYPAPKYPRDWTHEEYVEVTGDGGASPFTVLAPSTGVLPWIKDWTSSTPENKLNNGGNGSGPSSDPVNPPYGQDTHRVTDVLISSPPARKDDPGFFAWPVWARYTSPPNNAAWGTGPRDTDTGIIWDFTGRKALEEQDTTLQVMRNKSLTQDLKVTYAFNVPRELRNPPEYNTNARGSSGLWLPLDPAGSSPLPHDTFMNLVPNYHSRYYSKSHDPSSPLTSDLYNFKFWKNEPGYDSVSRLDFLFHLTGTPDDLFAARLDPAAPGPWYHKIRPFSYDIHDITWQRGGVTILNNVINPTRGEKTYIRYELTGGGRVTIQVFTLDGNLVKVLRRESRGAGEWTDVWDGKNSGGRVVARGMYFIRIVGPDIDEIRKVMVVK
jgi:hypothetical protein